MKKLFVTLVTMLFSYKACACVDCSGVGGNVSFGTVTAANFLGNTTSYIKNQSALQSDTTFYTSSGTVQEFNADESSFTTVTAQRMRVITTGTFEGIDSGSGTFKLMKTSGTQINGVQYGNPSAACSDGQLWKQFGGNWNCADDAAANGGVVVYSTNIVDGQLTGVDAGSGVWFGSHTAVNTIAGRNLARYAIDSSTQINAALVFTASSATYTSSITVTGLYGSTGSYLLLISSGMELNGLKYGYPGSYCTAGQVWKQQGGGNWSCADDNSGGGGGGVTSESTVTIKLFAGGDVGVSSSVFEAVPGAVFTAHFATMTVLGWEAYAIGESTVGTLTFRFAQSTSTQGGAPYTYSKTTTTDTVLSPNSQVTTYMASTTTWAINYRESVSLHITGVPASGTPVRSLSVLLRVRKGLDNIK